MEFDRQRSAIEIVRSNSQIVA
ncbi:hypothetical protein CCACVL1_09445 [Corchorus capsularis]|uniref:Uncharacterized protein n=1 Tax=Corchorus capsularis TaxID=210143 RepID=A0A1R3IW42_COCAP|nr:hypothetical protein CCACVL1_09445 [Corchorus capsularis]